MHCHSFSFGISELWVLGLLKSQEETRKTTRTHATQAIISHNSWDFLGFAKRKDMTVRRKNSGLQQLIIRERLRMKEKFQNQREISERKTLFLNGSRF